MAVATIETQETPIFNPEQFDTDFEAFTKTIPSIVAVTAPDRSDKTTQLGAFLNDEIENLDLTYPKLDAITPEQIESIRAEAHRLMDQITLLDEPRRGVYEAFVAQNVLQAELAIAMKAYKIAETDEEKSIAREQFMRRNIELYGEPDKQTYLSLLGEKITNVSQKDRSPEAEVIFAELQSLVPAEVLDPEIAGERFKPSAETVAWMHTVIESLHGDLLRHVPETDEPISSVELRDIFETIIREEFGEAAEGWEVVLKDAKAISVGAKSKRVIIPINRPDMSVAEVRRLVVHELGIHMLTAITGESTDIIPLNFGLSGYGDTQEGLGKVAEQALEGTFKEAGVDHYITAGLAYFDGKSFRDAFEVKWRMKLLEDLESGQVPTEEQITKARKIAADGPLLATTRIFRGTDELPLFKDLSYYNGSVKVWEYLEQIRGDDLQLSLLLAGKISTSKDHQRVVLESRSV